MKEYILKLRAWLDAQTARERLLVFGATVLGLFMIWDTFFMGPFNTRWEDAEERLGPIAREIEALQLEGERLAQELSIDLNEDTRLRRASLEGELARVDGEIAQETQNLIPPDEMPRVLKEILSENLGLHLVSLKSLPAEPLFEPNEAEEELMSAGVVFRHGVEIELEGGYLSTLRYLQALEELPWRFFWDSLEFEVVDYPESRITITVHSVSLKEGWIGV